MSINFLNGFLSCFLYNDVFFHVYCRIIFSWMLTFICLSLFHSLHVLILSFSPPSPFHCPSLHGCRFPQSSFYWMSFFSFTVVFRFDVVFLEPVVFLMLVSFSEFWRCFPHAQFCSPVILPLPHPPCFSATANGASILRI